MWLSTLQSIKDESSTNSKLQILQSHFDSCENSLLEQLFDLLLNYEVNSYISDINKLEKNLESLLLSSVGNKGGSDDFFITEIYNQLKFRKRRFKKIEWIELLKSLSEKCSTEEELKYFLQFITKSVTVGLSIQGYNKVAEICGKNKIPKFDCMRCSSMEDSQIDFNNCFVSVKKDGVNCTFHNGTFFTRNGGSVLLPIQQLELESVFKDFVVFGELVSSNRQSSAGLVNSALKMGVCSTLPVETLKLHIFDILPKKDFENQEFDKFPFHKRVQILNEFSNGENYSIIEHHHSKSIDEVYSWNDFYYSQGEEGVIANDYNAPFEFTRSKYRSKIKKISDGDFEVKGVTEHSTKKGRLGSLLISSSCGKIECNVGSGFTDHDRLSLWEERDMLIGKIVKVSFNNVIENSLFLPVFLELRNDKDLADDYNIVLSSLKNKNS